MRGVYRMEKTWTLGETMAIPKDWFYLRYYTGATLVFAQFHLFPNRNVRKVELHRCKHFYRSGSGLDYYARADGRVPVAMRKKRPKCHLIVTSMQTRLTGSRKRQPWRQVSAGGETITLL
ncbi:hypothetical protein PoB_004696300 [Plakobranchus ocellatus]|uniref:Uncharacterized protein n=1 Tax=Plakobranchus ocellatus TaxID=259542 RepID=A0AAV4BNV5_9GAST|nr:hypothetical protein PoB_004696300 [Plakobranchus ocellatus]